jgi:hypothetical protein
VVPVLLCGTLIGVDGIDWLQGKRNVFDPIGLVGFIGIYFFLIAPLLTVAWDHRLLYLPGQPDDYRPWIGGMAILNFGGLLIYRFIRSFFGEYLSRTRERPTWELDENRFFFLLAVGLVVSVALQIWIYDLYGGIQGYINAYMALVAGTDEFKGTGWMTVISESFPILAIMATAVTLRKTPFRRNLVVIAVILSCFAVLEIFFGGLRGSRAAIVLGLFWAVAIVHFYLRQIPKAMIFSGIVVVCVFAYLWGFYKTAGLQSVTALSGSEEREDLTRRTNRSVDMVMLSDLSRSDIQAFVLYKCFTKGPELPYAYGGTYAGALALLVPQAIWPSRPPTKVRWTSDFEYGNGAYATGLWSSRVYGLAGETMLNFGPLFVPFAFAILAIAVTWTERLRANLESSNDGRLLLVPLPITLCILILTNDSDEHLFYLVKAGTIPFLTVLMGCRWAVPRGTAHIATRQMEAAPGTPR